MTKYYKAVQTRYNRSSKGKQRTRRYYLRHRDRILAYQRKLWKEVRREARRVYRRTAQGKQAQQRYEETPHRKRKMQEYHRKYENAAPKTEHHGARWDNVEDERLWQTGMTVPTIAQQLGRTVQACKARRCYLRIHAQIL